MIGKAKSPLLNPNKVGGLKMTTNDIEKAEIFLCFKNGERAVGVTDDKILLNFIVQYVKFLQLDEEKMGTVSLSEIIKNQ